VTFSHWHIWTLLIGFVLGTLFGGTILGAIMGLFGRASGG